MFMSAAQIKAASPVHILRGLQLCILGCQRALQNPGIYTLRYARLLLFATAATFVLHTILKVPLFLIRHSLTFATYFYGQQSSTAHLLVGISFVQNWVLSLPFVCLNYLRSSRPELFDDLFMNSLSWADHIHAIKHVESLDATKKVETYSKCLSRYTPTYKDFFMGHTVQRTLLCAAIYATSYVPVIGPFVLPLASFYTLNRAIGLVSAGIIFCVLGLVLPRHYFIVLLQTYLSTRSLTRQILSPYFARVGGAFSDYEKAKWYREREGVLFGFTLPFSLLTRLPYVGVLAYGLASACAAFLLTKITHIPPVDSEELRAYAADEIEWTIGRRNLLKDGVNKVVGMNQDVVTTR